VLCIEGLQVATPAATMYVWAQLPERAQDSVTSAAGGDNRRCRFTWCWIWQIRRRVRPFALVHAQAVLEAAVERMAPSGLQLTEG